MRHVAETRQTLLNPSMSNGDGLVSVCVIEKLLQVTLFVRYPFAVLQFYFEVSVPIGCRYLPVWMQLLGAPTLFVIDPRVLDGGDNF